MARDFGPFPTKPMYEVVNRRMQKALAEATASTGFARTGQGAVTAGTGAQLVIAAYPDGALVDGLYVENPASETVTLTTNTNTNPRIDRLVMRLDMGAQTIAPFQIVGTPGTSPQIPPLVQSATVFDMPLCRYTMPGSGSAQNPGSIVDERVTTHPAPVTAPTNATPVRTIEVDSWANFIIPDQGRPYQVRPFAVVRAFATDATCTTRIRVGSTSLTAGTEPIVSEVSLLRGVAGADLTHPSHLSDVIIGPARVIGHALRTDGTGSWQITPAPSLVYEVIPA